MNEIEWTAEEIDIKAAAYEGLLEKYAVKKGGGYNHRYNLSDEILIKDNHIKAENNLKNLVKKAIKSKKTITVEVENLKQLTQGLNIKVINQNFRSTERHKYFFNNFEFLRMNYIVSISSNNKSFFNHISHNI